MYSNICIRLITYNLTRWQKPRMSFIVGDFKQWYLDIYVTLFNKTILIRIMNKNVYGGVRCLVEPFIKWV